MADTQQGDADISKLQDHEERIAWLEVRAEVESVTADELAELRDRVTWLESLAGVGDFAARLDEILTRIERLPGGDI